MMAVAHIRSAVNDEGIVSFSNDYIGYSLTLNKVETMPCDGHNRFVYRIDADSELIKLIKNDSRYLKVEDDLIC